MFIDDLTLKDCQSQESMEAAKTRLENRNIKVGKFKKILAFCDRINASASDSDKAAVSGPTSVEQGAENVVGGKKDSFTVAIGKDYSICENFGDLQEAAQKIWAYLHHGH